MKRIDLLIGAVILSALIFSFVGVATYDAASGEQDFAVAWAATSKDLTATGNRAGDGSTEVPLSVQTFNLTKVDLTIVVTGTGARANNVNVDIKIQPLNASEQTKRVTLPQGNMGNSPSAAVSIELGQAPQATQASGPSENETLAALAKQRTSTNGMGDWKIVFTVAGSNPSQLGLVAGNSYSFQITGKATSYAASLQPLTPDINR